MTASITPQRQTSAASLSLSLPSAAACAGVADSIQVVGYMVGTGPVPFQIAAVGLKVVLLLLSHKQAGKALSGIWFTVVLAGLLIASFIASPFKDETSLLQVVAFGVSLSLSLLLTPGGAAFGRYGRAFVNSIVVLSIVYLAMVQTGGIDSIYGRYTYFGGSSANLGAEICCIAFICACVVYNIRGVLLCAPVLLWVIVLVQGRSALIACALALIIKFSRQYRLLLRRQPLLVMVGTLLVVPPLLYLAAPYVIETFSNLLLLDDRDRGIGTGFVGRSDRWAGAWRLFLDFPLLGAGPAAYAVLDLPDSHSFFMFGLANLGLSFAIVLILLGGHVRRGFRLHGEPIAPMAAILLLAVFNDRFANMAPYPFIAYVMILSLSVAVGEAEHRSVSFSRFLSPRSKA